MTERRSAGAFFGTRPAGSPGLGIFLNAGHPSPAAMPELLLMLDDRRVDCVELAVPFPDSPTDGPLIRRSADLALTQGVDLDTVLALIAEVAPRLTHTRIVLLADWGHTVRAVGAEAFARSAAAAGADAALLHGLPPRVRAEHRTAAAAAGLPLVTTCYHEVSSPATMVAAAEQADAFVYLVAQYGRSGGGARRGDLPLAASVAALRAAGPAPIAVGFGITSAADVVHVYDQGADAALVGSAGIAVLESARQRRTDGVAALARFVADLRPSLLPA